MSIIQAMYAGSSALNSFSESMTVIGNNLANANTTAFKASTASFEDILIQTVGNSGAGAATQVGTGVGLADVRQDVTQGSFSSTTNVTDLSIDGRGFFIVQSLSENADGSNNANADSISGPRDLYYTRAGSFKKDLRGDLVTPGGMVLQGWELTIDGERIPTLDNINLTNFLNAPPMHTSLVTLGANLDSDAEALSRNILYRPDDPATYNFSTSVRVFDSEGVGHSLEVQFRKLPMHTPATAIGGSGVTSAKQGAGSFTTDDFGSGQEIGIDLHEDIQVNLTFTPVVNGVPGTPVVADPYIFQMENQADQNSPIIDTNALQVNGEALMLDPLQTYNVTYTTVRQEIGFDLSADSSVSLTFTPVSGGQPIQSTSMDLTAGHHSLDLRKDVMGQDGSPIRLANDTRYKITYTPSDGTLHNFVGDDRRQEVLGEDNDNTWEWHAVVQTSELDQQQQGAQALTAVDLTSTAARPDGADYTVGRLVFDNQGRLMQEGVAPITFQFAGLDPQEILFDFGDASGENGDSTNDYSKRTRDMLYTDSRLVEETGASGAAGSMQVAGSFATTKLAQNGFPPGFIDKLAVSQTGVLSGSYTNGQTKDLFQIALVDFKDETALEQRGSNLFVETIASGLPLEGIPQSGRLGSIVAYSLEQSNVDMSGEFVRMITTQRGFQANSRIITVADGMMEELMALKR